MRSKNQKRRIKRLTKTRIKNERTVKARDWTPGGKQHKNAKRMQEALAKGEVE